MKKHLLPKSWPHRLEVADKSLVLVVPGWGFFLRLQLTCAIVEGIEHGKQSADDKNVGVLVEHHLDGRRSVTEQGLAWTWLEELIATDWVLASTELQQAFSGQKLGDSSLYVCSWPLAGHSPAPTYLPCWVTEDRGPF